MQLSDLNIYELLYELKNKFNLKELDYYSFKFYIKESNSFKNHFSIVDGHRVPPIEQDTMILNIGNLDSADFFKLTKQLLSHHLVNISTYLFFLKITKYIDRFHIIFNFKKEKLSHIKIEFNKTDYIIINELEYIVSAYGKYIKKFKHQESLEEFNISLKDHFIDTKELTFKNIEESLELNKLLKY